MVTDVTLVPNRRQQKVFTKSFREKFEQIKVGEGVKILGMDEKLVGSIFGVINTNSFGGYHRVSNGFDPCFLPVNVGNAPKPSGLKRSRTNMAVWCIPFSGQTQTFMCMYSIIYIYICTHTLHMILSH